MSVVSIVQSTVRGEDALAALEQAIVMVKAGEIMDVAIAGVTPDGASYTVWSDCKWLQAQVGAVEILKAKLVNKILDQP